MFKVAYVHKQSVVACDSKVFSERLLVIINATGALRSSTSTSLASSVNELMGGGAIAVPHLTYN